MEEESLEEKVNNANKRVSLWDSLVTAYSTGKAIKTTLVTTALGYAIPLAIAAGAFVYTCIKAVNSAAKYVTRVLRDPDKYTRLREILNYTYESAIDLNPFGKFRRSTFIGTSISTANYILPF